MDLIQMTRELGKAIQASPEYKKMMEAQTACDADESLQEGIGEFNLVRMQLTAESQKEEKDADRLQELNGKLQAVYTAVMGNENMMAYNIAKQDLDALMQQVQGLLTLCLNGEDPDTCEVPEGGCSGSCSTCSGCH
ncbi:MAG: YlbF family regulator [Oscillospiraceae bacterium]|nr:YlbF family regulator [Oscillospiraceae bacterium]